MSNKYYIYVRGTWRELCTDSGRVCGAKVKFLYLREGALRAAPRAGVLRGLRTLAAGQPAAVRDGPHLSSKRRRSGKSERRRSNVAPTTCTHHCRCCNHKLDRVQTNIVNLSTSNIKKICKIDASTQVTQTLHQGSTEVTNVQAQPSRSSSSSGDNFQPKTNLKLQKNKRKRSLSADKSPVKKRCDVGNDVNTSSEEDVLITNCTKSVSANTKNTGPLSTKGGKNRKRLQSSSSSNTVTSSEVAPKKSLNSNQMRKRLRLSLTSSDSEVSLPRPLSKKLRPRKADREISPSILTRSMRTAKTNPAEISESDVCLELDICEEDVQLIRGFLLNSTFIKDFDLYRYDTDEQYKCNIFYKFHPCVNLERTNLNVLKTLQDDKVSLESFATNLGLQKVGTTLTDKKRYRMRKRYIEVGSDSASETNKENVRGNNQMEKRQKTDKMLPSFILSSDSETCRMPLKKASPKVKAVQLHPTKKTVKRSALREYSPLEDASIVRWVSARGRERRVNGNSLWRELQPAYFQLTGQSRSWHSLRNRYLRYILPALPALRLPAAQVARLRAAASTGEIKRKGRNRENSIFRARPVASAWAKRPGSGQRDHTTDTAKDDSAYNTEAGVRKRSLRSSGALLQQNNTSPPRTSPPRGSPPRGSPPRGSPTYAAITRRFASRHHSTPEPEQDVVTASRRRRLYNPNDLKNIMKLK